MPVADVRLLPRNDRAVDPDGDYVLYWMIAARRTRWSFGLQHAADEARRLGVPLLVFEPLRIGYRWASHRHHAFVIQGMVDNRARCAERGVTYLPYVEPEPDADKGLLAALAERAALVVTDHFPTFFLPRMVASAAAGLGVRVVAVDGNGLMPLEAPDRGFTVAHSYRRWMQKNLDDWWTDLPLPEPLARGGLAGAELPEGVADRWPAADLDALLDGGLHDLPLDASVGPVPFRGGPVAGEAALRRFVDARLGAYADARNHPDEAVASGLSPYFHFGHVSAHEAFQAVLDRDGVTLPEHAPKANGKQRGWWPTSPEVEAFLEELLVWRELAYLDAHQRPQDHARFTGLPDWARETLAEHADDPREPRYDLEAFEHAETHDDLWNAAQRQLVEEGRIHNYLRMLWGKKILHWTGSPEEAWDVLVHLNNRYAVDGRDPSSYAGIAWVLGRFDRAWGPERPIFGKVRYMTSDSTRKKLRLSDYLERFGG